ncbi:cytochrome c [Gluconobacter kanchanaburiensis]|uniref:Alcohol dehydrogenase n=1 Tax=Gluconobacter kanchanaburiensis NBRC 103587 TaxID=1307948 RepID=A0A511B9F0_9PROT|nr:cytochrome c [Gluconobacter kanchanaburiensis]MBF0862777.1 cytochrome c [Gluconobacter kanchanaburiensis]GBR68492.1 sorbitol dehydrogenase cytochrome c subunit [Gluconobacter kanchanaburiensis NBRC 103587]GEK97056.1 alcohol dehydrogenase [Gluconobacter kanchanaburiensis NBRC 103587]
MKTSIKKTLGITALAGGIVVAAGVGVIEYNLHRDYPMTITVASGDALKAKIARGQYVAFAADCAACHTVPGGASYAGGYSLDTPFGKILASNITSDKETGIGAWSEQQFNRAVRHGIGSHGYLYPAMPYTAYAKMTDQDIDDLWAYIRTVPAVDKAVVENQLPFPYNQRFLLAGWNFLFFHTGVFEPRKSLNPEQNRGAYLVEGAGHCAACHTPKNALGGDSSGHAFQGGTLQGWYAPDLTPNPYIGLGGQSVADIVTYLKTGSNKTSVASGPMTEAVENSTQHLTDADLHAIVTYLRTLPASSTSVPIVLAANDPRMLKGKLVFQAACMACHVPNASGIPNMIPAFAKNPIINAPDPSSLIHTVLRGMLGPQTWQNPTGAGMPRFDWKMPDDNMADVLTFIRNSWGNAAPPVTAAMISQMRKNIHADMWSGIKKPENGLN